MQSLGELAKHYQKNEQAIRRAFKVMLKLNRLKLGQDYKKENFKDNKHFTYLIDQKKFDEHYRKIDRRFEEQFAVSSDIKTDIKKPESDNQVISNDIRDDYIGTLKDQLHKKDGQIESLNDQNKDLQKSLGLEKQLNIMLNQELTKFLPQGKDKNPINATEGEIKNEPEITYHPEVERR